ncbi:flavin reductase family protein [Galbibacter pacificus]|uniref:Flavin reductase family protein n=1 Tax=Galbibacter pacificus TaxID=2996052 RepID=A0ABT6FT54_9FLAO|nr:flavin reductase family protein [Galbibacter pacificus]MDG3582446.1 flavin reductase family protein [Galbibacter pacificus]MDG3586436.1 flavin reductase family protein [Galbibacter pacificus]
MLSIDPKTVSTAELHGFLLSAVAPRPIAFASTMDKDGNVNLSPFSFFNVYSSKPPVMIFSANRRVRDNSTKHTLENVLETKEVVVNIVNFAIVQQVSLSSTEYPKEVNEFEKSGLTMLKSDTVKPFRVAESPVQFECKVNEVIALGDEGGAGNLIVCEVLKMHINEAVLGTDGKIDQHKIDLVSRMGSNWYCRANLGMFEVPKPLSSIGIGVDNIPSHIRYSKILTGNDLGILGNVDKLPTKEEINTYIEGSIKIREVLSTDDTEQIHKKAQELIVQNDVLSAWKVLLAK